MSNPNVPLTRNVQPGTLEAGTLHARSSSTVSTRAAVRIVLGAALALVGVVGAIRTFDPVQLSAVQAAFLLVTVLGVAITEVHLRD